ncbi:hypothetical protein AB395_00001268 [Sinorhizobium fredii CCBAU 45436]|nr:hypothetical protein SF83666_c12390 [Sinorhizobium fredii CCBAU 83666]AWI56936.1 hypothetical protein AB395_00001268 [Sinorhizobium fredii CCBAU 45436]AWM24742.1 hypothetical protein AOX55_00001475 [Sinorhizobium fredii CCBAU 25509]
MALQCDIVMTPSSDACAGKGGPGRAIPLLKRTRPFRFSSQTASSRYFLGPAA